MILAKALEDFFLKLKKRWDQLRVVIDREMLSIFLCIGFKYIRETFLDVVEIYLLNYKEFKIVLLLSIII